MHLADKLSGSLAAKILIAFLLIFILLGFVNVFTLINLNRVTEDLNTINRNILPLSNKINQIMANRLLIANNQKKYANSYDPSLLDQDEVLKASNQRLIADSMKDIQYILDYEAQHQELQRIARFLLRQLTDFKEAEFNDDELVALLYRIRTEMDRSVRKTSMQVQTRQLLLIWLSVGLYLIFSFIGIYLGFLVYRTITRQLYPVLDSLKQISEGEGDLTTTLPVLTTDEIGELSWYFNKFLDRQCGLVRNIMHSSHLSAAIAEEMVASMDEINTAAKKINQFMNMISGSSDHLVTIADRAASGMISLQQNVQTIDDRNNAALSRVSALDMAAQEAFSSAQVAGSRMDAIKESVTQTKGEVMDLQSKISQIQNILSVINTISKRTNLLALNAAIEAARAGEAGKGFVVVADTIRQLADSTTQATRGIKDIVERIIENVNQVAASMSKDYEQVDRGGEVIRASLNKLELIADSVGDFTAQFNTIKEFLCEHRETAQNVKDSVSNVYHYIQETADLNAQANAQVSEITETINTIRETSNELAGNASQLTGLVSKFNVK